MDVSGYSGSMVSSMSQDFLTRIRGSGNKPSAEEFAGSLVEEKDTDGDGLLSVDEAGIETEHFDSADADGDGFLSEEEIKADMEKAREQMDMMGKLTALLQGDDGQSFAEAILGEYDEDGDGSLSQEEIGLSDELFGALDADGDGLVTAEELQEAMQPPESAGLSAASVSDQTAGTESGGETEESEESSSGSSSSSDDDEYDEYDLNKDGVVSTEELRQAYLDGDMSLAFLFDRGESQNGPSNFMRIAMNAYNLQSVQM